MRACVHANVSNNDDSDVLKKIVCMCVCTMYCTIVLSRRMFVQQYVVVPFIDEGAQRESGGKILTQG